ncbi:MAG: hypothetical protein ACP5OC_08965 [Thermoplasmata archaeon]
MRHSRSEIETALENFIKENGACRTDEIIKFAEEKFSIGRSTFYNIWNSLKKDKIRQATIEDLAQYGKQRNHRKGNERFWIHIDSSHLQEEFLLLVNAIRQSASKHQFLDLLGQLEDTKYINYATGRTGNDVVELNGMLLSMLFGEEGRKIDPGMKYREFLINTAELREYSSAVTGLLLRIYRASPQLLEPHYDLYFKVLEKLKGDVLQQGIAGNNMVRAFKDLALIVSYKETERLNRMMFSIFTENLLERDRDFNKILGVNFAIKDIMSFLSKERHPKKFGHGFWAYIWKVALKQLETIPPEILGDDYKNKISETMEQIIADDPQRPNRYQEFLKSVKELREFYV